MSPRIAGVLATSFLGLNILTGCSEATNQPITSPTATPEPVFSLTIVDSERQQPYYVQYRLQVTDKGGRSVYDVLRSLGWGEYELNEALDVFIDVNEDVSVSNVNSLTSGSYTFPVPLD